MNPQLIAEIAKFLGKNVKWVVIVIATAGTGILVWYLRRHIKSLEKKKDRAEETAKAFNAKIQELEQAAQNEKEKNEEQNKKYIEIIARYKKLYYEALENAYKYANDIDKANGYIALLSAGAR